MIKTVVIYVKEELIKLGYISNDEKINKTQTPITKINYKGFDIYIGKNNKQNDYLISKIASSEDLWFHGQGFTSSHVILKILNNKKVSISREGIYKSNPFLKSQSKAIKDFCETKKIMNKSLKSLPGIMKGTAFVCASIAGYKLGSIIADSLINSCKSNNKS